MRSVPFRGSQLNPHQTRDLLLLVRRFFTLWPTSLSRIFSLMPTLSSGSTSTDYCLSAHAAPSARSTFPSCIGLTISSSLSRLKLEISASEKLSLGSLSPQVPLVSGPMEPCTSPSCWIIIACLPVSSAKLRSPWQLELCLSGSWLYLVLHMLSSWEVLKMYLLNEWVNEVKIFFPILWYSYFLSLYPLFPHYYNYYYYFLS